MQPPFYQVLQSRRRLGSELPFNFFGENRRRRFS